jgi:hypothetical protein
MPYKQRMSPKKLAATLAAILRDFEPWKDPDRDHQWGGPQVQLSKEQVRVLPRAGDILELSLLWTPGENRVDRARSL